MVFLESLAIAQKMYSAWGFFSAVFIDQTALIMQQISEKELKSAIQTLKDCKKSNNIEREFSSAITQLKLALEKTDDSILKCKIATLIAFCYGTLNGSPVTMVIRKTYLNKQANNFSLKDLKVLKP